MSEEEGKQYFKTGITQYDFKDTDTRQRIHDGDKIHEMMTVACSFSSCGTGVSVEEVKRDTC